MSEYIGDFIGFLVVAAIVIAMWAANNRVEHVVHCRKGCIGHWKHGNRDELTYFGEKKNEAT